jgi:hypothetical protein
LVRAVLGSKSHHWSRQAVIISGVVVCLGWLGKKWGLAPQTSKLTCRLEVRNATISYIDGKWFDNLRRDTLTDLVMMTLADLVGVVMKQSFECPAPLLHCFLISLVRSRPLALSSALAVGCLVSTITTAAAQFLG